MRLQRTLKLSDDRFSIERLGQALDGHSAPGATRPGEAELVQVATRLRSIEVAGPDASARNRMESRFEAFFEEDGSSGIWAVLGAWFGLNGRAQPQVARFAAGAILLVAAGSGGSLAAGTTPWVAAGDIVQFAGNAIVNLNPNRSFDDGDSAATADENTPTPSATAAANDPSQDVQPPAGAGAGQEPSETPTPAAEGSPPLAASGTSTPNAPVLGTPSNDAVPPTGTPSPASPIEEHTPETTPGSVAPTPGDDAPSATPGDEPTPGTAIPTSTSATPAATTPTPATTTPAAETTTPGPSGTPSPQQTTFPVQNAGSVTYSFDGSSISLINVVATPGWSFDVEENTGDELVVRFERDEQSVSFKVSVENGSAVPEVEEGDGD